MELRDPEMSENVYTLRQISEKRCIKHWLRAINHIYRVLWIQDFLPDIDKLQKIKYRKLGELRR